MKDLAATALVGAAAALTWATVTTAGWPLTGSVRITAGVVFVLGLAACATGSAEAWEPDAAHRPWHARLGSGVSTAATVAALWAMIAGSQTALIVETATIVALWAFATVRHLVTRDRRVAASAA